MDVSGLSEGEVHFLLAGAVALIIVLWGAVLFFGKRELDRKDEAIAKQDQAIAKLGKEVEDSHQRLREALREEAGRRERVERDALLAVDRVANLTKGHDDVREHVHDLRNQLQAGLEKLRDDLVGMLERGNP